MLQRLKSQFSCVHAKKKEEKIFLLENFLQSVPPICRKRNMKKKSKKENMWNVDMICLVVLVFASTFHLSISILSSSSFVASFDLTDLTRRLDLIADLFFLSDVL